MPKYILTVVTKGDNYLHSAHETEEEAKNEQKELLAALNNVLEASRAPFYQIGDYSLRLADVVRSQVNAEDDAPGYHIGFD